MDKNISTLLREIKAATRWSESQIAAEIPASQPTVNRILHGQEECKASTFRAIQALHAKQCGTAPRIPASDETGGACLSEVHR